MLSYVGIPCQCSVHSPCLHAPPLISLLRITKNRRKRRALKKSQKPSERSTLFEFACSLNSQLGMTSDQCNINHIGLCKERIDLSDENQCSQLDYQIGEAAKVAPPNLWSSIPCTSGSPWQYINRKKGGAAYMKRLALQLRESKRLQKLDQKGWISFETRRHCFFRMATSLNWLEETRCRSFL